MEGGRDSVALLCGITHLLLTFVDIFAKRELGLAWLIGAHLSFLFARTGTLSRPSSLFDVFFKHEL